MYITSQLCVSHCSDTNVKVSLYAVRLIPSHPTSSLLTRHGKTTQRTGLSLGLTHPLLAALSRHLDPAWHGAVGPGQHHIHGAAWHAANLPIAAHALVLAAGEEDLAIPIDRTIQNANSSLMSWRKETNIWLERIQILSLQWQIRTCVLWLLTQTDASPLADVYPVFTLQPFTCVTGVHFRAHLTFLTGTHQAAGAVIQDQGHPGETHGGLLWALASARTPLGPGKCKHLGGNENESVLSFSLNQSIYHDNTYNTYRKVLLAIKINSIF